MDQAVRNKLRNAVTQCRKVLEDATAQALQGRFGIYAGRKKGEVHIEEESRMGHLAAKDRACRRDLIEHLNHIQAIGYKPREAFDQLVREIAFTHLNRLCAYKMMEARGLIREAVSRGVKSQGFFFYLADHPEDEKLHRSGQQEAAYRHFLDWLGGTLSEEIGVLFNPNDPANRIYPPQRVLDEVLALINSDDLNGIWTEDEAIGWVYQYFTPKELRDQARKESQAPRNSYELAFRNQFYTPRYVVEFLTDNTLGRIWYEMRKGETSLKDLCWYLVRRPVEIFLKEGEETPAAAREVRDDLSQEELLKRPVYIPHRAKKDPREIKILDPACGSGHFLLYCFDLLQVIYEEAYADPELGPALKRDYPTLDELRRALPGLILKHNLHGIDIDLRATQIAALALWLRCQRAYQDLGLPNGKRPKITRSNIVCAEPMPGEADLLKEFTATLQPKVLGQLVEVVFEKMKLAGEAGSLLKIEEEIQEAVAAAKKEYQAEMRRRKDEAGFLPGMAPPREATLFDFADMTDEAFLDRAEGEIVEALRRYATKAENGRVFRRKLFAEDAAQGFAFIDLCRKRYDVVLMNPPFGAGSPLAVEYMRAWYPTTSIDIAYCFLDRAHNLTLKSGLVGTIINRTGFFIAGLADWRKQQLLCERHIAAFIDLGYGVLDEALVEVALVAIESRPPGPPLGCYIDLLPSMDKQRDLVDVLGETSSTTKRYVAQSVFSLLPDAQICHWVSPRVLKTMMSFPRLGSGDEGVQHGTSTKDDFRFLRTAWEVPPNTVGKGRRWVHYAKGGEYQPYFDDLSLLVDWEQEGRRIEAYVLAKYPYLKGNANWVMHRECSYFKPGITYPERTTSDFSPRVLPTSCVFSVVGQSVFFRDVNRALVFLGLSYTRPVKLMIECLVGGGDSSVSGSAARHYRMGLINELRIPWPPERKIHEIAEKVRRMVALAQEQWATNICARLFVRPGINGTSGSLLLGVRNITARRLQNFVEASTLSWELDRLSFLLFGFDEQQASEVERLTGAHPLQLSGSNEYSVDDVHVLFQKSTEDLVRLARERIGACRQTTKKGFFWDRHLELLCLLSGLNPSVLCYALSEGKLQCSEVLANETRDMLDYAVGVTAGRWDVRLATGERQPPELPDPFDPLPVCPPGMLQGPDGLPAKPEDVPSDYPIRINWEGILVDDPEHQDDIVRRVRDVLEVIWKDRAEAIEKEACEILGVRELRDYFRKPANGGFWMDHVKRYSKSRRKAPIYWYLRSAKGNYGLWLYYHRLHKDILFKALLNYVEPKIGLEEDRLNTLRSRKEKAGSSGREAKQIEKEIDRQEQFVSELHDFKDKLRCAADLHITPDLNDGVVLNIAPLWELVPWKEAQKYWEELQEGKYDWAHVARQLWPDRVKEKCRTDRSIAIAHGLEHLCEVPPPKASRAAATAETPVVDQEEPGEEYADDEVV